MALNDSFGNLVNDITQQVLEQVQQQVRVSIADAITQRIDDLITADVINTVVTNEVQQRIINFQPDMSVFEKRIIDAGDRIINTINTDSIDHINDLITNKINSVNIEALVTLYIADSLNTNGRHLSLVPGAIPGSAIDPTDLKISGDNIADGVIQNFASTGIDDKATSCKLTILDAGTVFENTLYAPMIEIKGNAVIEGDLLVQGVIPRDSQTYQNIINDVNNIADANQEKLLTKLQTETFDINRLTIGQRSIIEGDTLTSAVINSQLQRVGVLKDLQTAGESLLSETLYTTNRRVGINTMDPNTALSVWDEEVEIGIGKQIKDTAQINSRYPKFIISSNNQKNIILTDDGTTAIPRLQLGNMLMTTGATPPSYNAQKGTIVFNENPSLGGPLGWVSLGDARWANFGIID
jgi:hypothetical protein